MGGGRGSVSSYGSLEGAEAGLQRFGTSILSKVMEEGVISIGAAAFPQFAGLLYAGYAAYQGMRTVHGILKEYQQSSGSPAQRAIRVGMIEGAKILVSNSVGKLLDKPTNQMIERAVQATTNIFSQGGVFTEIAKRVGKPQQGEDLEYFFATAAERSLIAAYDEAKSQVSQYVAEGLVR
jgi:hypothetical protein